MWKPYLKFLRLAVEEQFPQATYRPLMKVLWGVIVIVVGFFVSDYLGVRLKDVAEPIFHLLPVGWWVVVVLGLAVIALLLAINGARRFHEKTVSGVYEASEGVAKEHAGSVAKIELFTLYKGRFDALYLLLDNRRWKDSKGPPVSRAEIEYHEADFSNMLLERFGDDYRTKYFKQLGDIPESVLGQTDRLRTHSNLMHQQIQTERGRQQTLAHRSNEEKRRTLENTGSPHIVRKNG